MEVNVSTLLTFMSHHDSEMQRCVSWREWGGKKTQLNLYAAFNNNNNKNRQETTMSTLLQALGSELDV